MPKTARASLSIPKATYEKFQNYHELTGVPISHAVNEALEDWLEHTASTRMEALTKQLDSQHAPS